MFPTRKKIILLLFLLFSGWILLGAPPASDSLQIHELTIFVIPAPVPLDWSSPSALYSSFKKGYLKQFLRKEKYTIGHLFLKFSSPLATEPFYTAIRSASKKEMRQLVLREKIGLGILGAGLSGRLETTDELKPKISIYQRRGELAFITYRINEAAARRILTFLETFAAKFDDKHAPCDFYGGDFWPRFEHEGAGCTALGLSALDVAGLLGNVPREWRVTVNIPMDLIGGSFNQHRQVKNKTIRARCEWHTPAGLTNIDYVPFSIYDPARIYRWILKNRDSANPARDRNYLPVEQDQTPGLYIDCRHIGIDEREPIFRHRETPSFFTGPHYQKIGVAMPVVAE